MRHIENRSSKSLEYLELSSPKRRGRTLQRTPPSERNQSTPPGTGERPLLSYERRRKRSSKEFRRHSASPSFRTGSLSLLFTSSSAAQNIIHLVGAVGTTSNQQVPVQPLPMARQFAFVPFN